MIVGKKACSIDHTCTLPLKGLTIAQRKREESVPNDSPNNYRLASVVVAKKQDH